MLLPTRASSFPRLLLLSSLLIATLISGTYYYRAVYYNSGYQEFAHPGKQILESGGDDGFYGDGVDEELYNAQKAAEAAAAAEQSYPGPGDVNYETAYHGAGGDATGYTHDDVDPAHPLDHETVADVMDWMNNGGNGADIGSDTGYTDGAGLADGTPPSTTSDGAPLGNLQTDPDDVLVNAGDTYTPHSDGGSHADDIDDENVPSSSGGDDYLPHDVASSDSPPSLEDLGEEDIQEMHDSITVGSVDDSYNSDSVTDDSQPPQMPEDPSTGDQDDDDYDSEDDGDPPMPELQQMPDPSSASDDTGADNGDVLDDDEDDFDPNADTTGEVLPHGPTDSLVHAPPPPGTV